MSSKSSLPQDRRARLITTWEGKWLNLSDIKDALADPAFIEYCAVMMVVGHNQGDDYRTIVRHTLGSMIFTLSGEEAARAGGEKSQ